ncbi:MAG: methyltransferase domain-containing protein [Candidatus Latescibacteria bacterium]|nr:methyltransferase domain-containing protein [Candidatus Latescibacterota bacterium]
MLAIKLVQGCAERLPFKNSFFDLVFCVNAIHHFDHPHMFIYEAYRVLSAYGTLAVIGTEPHGQKDSWYGFHFFEGTYETDLKRFPAWETVSDWMIQAGLRIIEIKRGREVLKDPYLRKNACSRLALLSDEAYNAGLESIEAAIAQAEARGETIVFRTDMLISMLTGYKAGSSAVD